MSMFHELMMRKKEQTMYATIKGTLTENNGVFSGFSASDYLKIQNLGEKISTANKWEFVTKIHTSLTNSGQCILGNNVDWGTNVRINSENQLILNVSNITTSTDIGSITGTTVLSDNTDYYVKVEFTGTQYILSLSIDGTAWSNEGYINSSTKIIDRGDWLFGAYSVSIWYFRGAIDLNQSYIKINNTKYQLQAVVGYTIVGNPTIVDGVVSGFSSSDYLNINKSSGDVYNFEMIAHIGNIPQTISGNQLICALQGDITSRLFLASNNTIRFQYKDINNSTRYLDISTIPIYIKIILNENDEQIYSSNDGINWSLEASKTYSPILINMFTSIRFGYLSNTFNVFNGDLYIKDTSIKVNNKLWFNGQPAE